MFFSNKTLKTFIFIIIFSPVSYTSFSQNISINNEISYYYEKQSIGKDNFHQTIKPFRTFENDWQNIEVDTLKIPLSFFLDENLISKKTKNFNYVINPIFSSVEIADIKTKNNLYDFKAGLSGNFNFKNKIYLNSDFFYGKLKLPEYETAFLDSFSVLPGYSDYISASGNSINYLSFTGELTYKPAKYIDFSVGNGKHFLGNGYRSLFLSDNSANYPYFKTTVKIWKVKYFWLIGKLDDFNVIKGSEFNDKSYDKYLALHYLSINLTKNINFNFFEAVVTSPYDQRGKYGINPTYLNPVIFYRPVEFASGSAGNSLMGAGLNIRLWKTYTFYSQLIIDELIFSQLKNRGSWYNKQGLQAGMKVFDFLKIKNLYFQGEINSVRPYTYTHQVSNINYGNKRQPLAHPLGANFMEALSVIRYDFDRLSLQSKIILSQTGLDNDTLSFGQDIYKSYRLRVSDSNNKITQGEKTKSAYIEFKAGYLINPNYNMKLEFGFALRKIYGNTIDANNGFLFFGISTKIFNDELI